MLVQPEGFTDQAAQAIATDGVAGGLHRHRQSDSRTFELIGTCCKGEICIAEASTARICLFKIDLATQTPLRGKSVALAIGAAVAQVP